MSEVKVNKISPRTNCGTTQLGDAGDTITVSGDLKSNSLKPATGTTLTLGASGDTVTLASGASQSGFGRTGTVDWQTGSIKTATFTATSGEGYFVNTTGGAITVNLPAGSAGDIIGLKDYAGTWDTNAVTLNANGSDKIGGGNTIDPTLTDEGGSVLLVFVDSTQGWLTTQQSVTTSPSGAEQFISATGGTITESGNYRIHTFTGPGTFTVSSLATCSANNTASYMVVAGGGGPDGGAGPGGGGAGGFREFKAPNATGGCYTASPIATTCNGVTLAVQGYPVTVGAGGGPGNGSNSTFNCITSAGGGAGRDRCSGSGNNGGSGGGGGDYNNRPGGNGNTPPVSPSQGFPGARGTACEASGGGGGATSGGPTGTTTANPGNGATTSITGSPIVYSIGGDGEPPGNSNANAPFRGSGFGHGNGGTFPGSPSPSSNVKQGVVIIRYKYQ